MFELLFALVLAVHLIFVNIASGAPLLALGCEWAADRSSVARRAGRYLTVAGLIALLIGLALGGVLFGLRWSPSYAESLSRLNFKLASSVGELVFSVLLYVVSWLMWRTDAPSPTWKRATRGLIALANGANLLYHFPFLFLVLERVVRGEVEGSDPLRGPRFRSLMMDGETPSIAVHVMVASIAMAAVALFGLALRLRREGAPAEDARAVAVWGGRAAAVATLAQLPVGLWIMTSLHPSDQTRILGGDTAAFLCFIGGVVGALWLLQQLAVIANGETERQALIKSMSLSVVVVVLMTVAWRLARP